MTQEIIDISKQAIKESDCILIGAGAGLSAAAGLNYSDKEAFAKYYPAWLKRGFQMQYQLMGYQGWTQAEQWGYYTAHLDYVYYSQKSNELYQQLSNVVGDKDCFVMTSNVDELFHKNGFGNGKIYTPQGSYGKIQCTIPCTNDVWDVRPFYDKMLAALDPITQVLSEDEAIPKCPNCGENMFLNVRIDHSFLDQPYIEELKRFQSWIHSIKKRKIVLIEFGAGLSTPGVIRLPMQELHSSFSNAFFIRVNMEHARIPNEKKSLSVKGDIREFISSIC